MPISKGSISKDVWHVLAVSLKSDGYFSKARVSGSAFSFLRLQRNAPEIAAAITEVFDNDTSFQAELYSMQVGAVRHRFVFGASGKDKELMYPAQIDTGLENSLLLNALLEAKQNLLSFLWNQEGRLSLLFLFPFAAAYAAFLGWTASGAVQPGFIDGFMRIFSILIFMFAFGIAISPWVWAWRKRHILRQALKQITDDTFDQRVRLIRARLRSSTK